LAADFRVDFIGIGAEKAATDWVACCLREHPEVCFSKHKELVFFSDYDQHLLKVRYRQYERGIGWYEKQFNHCPADSVKGEYTPTYLYSQEVARRIYKHYPDVKLIVCLRDPVERAFSQYLHDISIALIPQRMTFEEALAWSHSYVEKGRYCKYLTYYYELFPPEQVLVLLVDDIKEDSRAAVRRLYRFLELKEVDFVPPSLNRRPNAAAQAHWPWLNRIMLYTDYFLREHGMEGVLHLLEDSGLRRLAVHLGCRVNQRPIAVYPSINENTALCLRQQFLPDIESLEKLLARDLTEWKPCQCAAGSPGAEASERRAASLR